MTVASQGVPPQGTGIVCVKVINAFVSCYVVKINMRFCLNSERWVLHSTMEYARSVIARTGVGKLSIETLNEVAEEMFQEFQDLGLGVSKPFFSKAHRWYATSNFKHKA